MIQDDVLRFDYNGSSGKLAINLGIFFPADKGRVRKLMKILSLSDWRQGQVARELVQWLEERRKVTDYDTTLRAYAAKVVDARTKMAEIQEPIDKQAARVSNLEAVIKALPRGKKKPHKEALKVEKDKLKDLKAEYQKQKSEAAYYNGAFIRAQAAKTRMDENISLIRELSAEWQ